MTHKINVFTSFYLLIILGCTTPTFCQSIERLLDKKGVEVGCAFRWYDRYFASDYGRIKWGINNLVLRYGFTEWLTGSLEGYISNNHDNKFPDRDYRDYTYGFGFGSKIWAIDNFQVIFGIHYLERLDFDRSANQYHKLQGCFFATLKFQQRFYLSSAELLLFLSPAFVRDQLDEYTPGCSGSAVSVHNFGISIGFDILAYQHVHLVAQILFADYWQPRLGIGYVF